MQAAATSRATPGSSSTTVSGPAATVSGRGRPSRRQASSGAERRECRAGRGRPGRGTSRLHVRPRPEAAGPQRGDPDRHGRGRRHAEAERAGVRIVAEPGGLAGEQRADGGHGVGQLVGGVDERDVVEALRQRGRARAEAEHVAAAGDLVEGRRRHGQGAGGAAPDGQDAGKEPDPFGGQRDLGQQGGRLQPPALGHREHLVAQLVGQPRGAHHHRSPGLHRGERHAPAAGGHGPAFSAHAAAIVVHSFPGSAVRAVTADMGNGTPAVRTEITPPGTSIRYLTDGWLSRRRRGTPTTPRSGHER